MAAGQAGSVPNPGASCAFPRPPGFMALRGAVGTCLRPTWRRGCMVLHKASRVCTVSPCLDKGAGLGVAGSVWDLPASASPCPCRQARGPWGSHGGAGPETGGLLWGSWRGGPAVPRAGVRVPGGSLQPLCSLPPKPCPATAWVAHNRAAGSSKAPAPAALHCKTGCKNPTLTTRKGPAPPREAGRQDVHFLHRVGRSCEAGRHGRRQSSQEGLIGLLPPPRL